MKTGRSIRDSFIGRGSRFGIGIATTLPVSLLLLGLSPLYTNENYPIERWLVFGGIGFFGLIISLCWALGNGDLERKMKFYLELDDELKRSGRTDEQREEIRKMVMRDDDEKNSGCWCDDYDCGDF